MPKYDFVFLLNEETELKNLKDLISQLSGKLLKEESWGKKTLAYPIKKNMYADFYNWELELDQNHIAELKKKLNFNEKILRYLLMVEN